MPGKVGGKDGGTYPEVEASQEETEAVAECCNRATCKSSAWT
jgi:hypothetical protein